MENSCEFQIRSDQTPYKLEVIQNKYKDNEYICQHTCHEVTSLCPCTGMPDFYTLIIKYTPNLKLIELKSLKLYLINYRNRGIFHEELLNEIFDDFKSKIEPKRLLIELVVNNRGGIFTSVKREWPESE
jgi:7-cyano-7-deazaguanine reductase